MSSICLLKYFKGSSNLNDIPFLKVEKKENQDFEMKCTPKYNFKNDKKTFFKSKVEISDKMAKKKAHLLTRKPANLNTLNIGTAKDHIFTKIDDSFFKNSTHIRKTKE